MDNWEYDELKTNFFKIYANIPLPLRSEIIAVAGDETFTWSSAREEIKRDRKNSKKILQLLKDMEVI